VICLRRIPTEGIAAAEAKKTPIDISRSQRSCRLVVFFLLEPSRYPEKVTRPSQYPSRKIKSPRLLRTKYREEKVE
jgi:hypothetical protein